MPDPADQVAPVFRPGLRLEDLTRPMGVEPAGIPKNPFLEVAEQQQHEREFRLRQSLGDADQNDPARAAEVWKLSEQIGHPKDFVDRNLDATRQAVRVQSIPYEQITRDNPALAEWMATPQNAQVAKDDLERLSGFEYWSYALPRAWQRKADAEVYAELAYKKEYLGGTLTQAEQTELERARESMTRGNVTDPPWWTKPITGAVELMEQMVTPAKSAIAAGGAMAAGGFVAGGPPGAVAGFAAGTELGGAHGVYMTTVKQETMEALTAMRGWSDEYGRPLDPGVIKAAAFIAGNINAGLEVAGLEWFLHSFSPAAAARKPAVNAVMKQALRSPTFRSALLHGAKGYLTVLGQETGQEVAQNLVTMTAEEVAKLTGGVGPAQPRGGPDAAKPSGRSEVTTLTPEQETAFQAWAQTNQIPDVDNPAHKYDYRGFFKVTGGAPIHYGVDHFPDAFKQHGHPTFSEESVYSNGPGDGGTWQGETFIPAAQNTGPWKANDLAPRSVMDWLRSAGETAIDAGLSFSLGLLPGPARATYRELRTAQDAQARATALQGLADMAKASETLKRAPQAFQDFAERVTKNGPVEHIYVDPEVWKNWAEKIGVDPADLAAQVVGSRDAYTSATDEGRRMQIPTARYATVIGPTPHHDTLFPDLHFGDPDAPSLNDGKAARERALELIDQAIREAQAAPEGPTPAPQGWKGSAGEQEFLKIIRATGQYSEAQVQAQAEVFGGIVGDAYTRAGLDPAQFIDKYQIRITAPEQQAAGIRTDEGVTRPDAVVPATPAGVDQTAGITETPPPTSPQGQFISQQILTGLEGPAAAGVTDQVTPGEAPLEAAPAPEGDVETPAYQAWRRELELTSARLGLTPTEAVAHLPPAPARYEPVNLLDPGTIRDAGAHGLLNPAHAVDTSFNGPALSQSLFTQVEAPHPTADRLTDDTLPPDRIAAPRPAARDTAIGPGDELAQTVYHATPVAEPFEQFSLQFIGSGTGGQTYGWGLYFASQRAVADRYREMFGAYAGGPDVVFTGLTPEENAAIPNWTKNGIVLGLPTGRIEAAIEDFEERIAQARREIAGGTAEERAAAQAQGWGNIRDPHPQPHLLEENIARHQQTIAALRKLAQVGSAYEVPLAGHTYTVTIPDDHVYLNYDRALSEQPAAVQAGLRALGITWEPLVVPPLVAGPTGALALFDTPRIQAALTGGYPDADTLGTGLYLARERNYRGWREWYVKHSELLTGVPRTDITGGELYERLEREAQDAKPGVSDADAAREASETLNGVGIPGIQYLDGFSRATGEGSSNYVLWDPELAQIVEYDQPLVALTDANVQEWTADLRARVGPDLLHFEVHLTDAGDLHLASIIVDRGAQRAGVGTKVVQELTRLADLNNKRITLSPAERGPLWGDTSRDALVSFYKRFGFVENTDRYRDLTTGDTMYRDPTFIPGLPTARRVPGPMFYSRLSLAVQHIKQERATGQQWARMIERAPTGVNKDEFVLAGLRDLEPARMYTRQEVFDYLSANKLEVEEHDIVEPRPEEGERAPTEPDHDQVVERAREMADDDEERFANRYDARNMAEDRIGRHEARYNAETEEWEAWVGDTLVEDGFTTRADADDAAYTEFDSLRDQDKEEWVTEQMEPPSYYRERAYDEMAEYMDEDTPDQDQAVREWEENRGGRYGLYSEGGGTNYRERFLVLPELPPLLLSAEEQEFDALKSVTHTRAFTAEELARYNALEAKGVGEAITQKTVARGHSWHDGHDLYDDVDRPIIRIRLTDRVDEQGRKVLFVEEMQPPLKSELGKMPPMLARNAYKIGVRWLLRQAAEGNYAALAWTPGFMQARRYGGLERVIHKVEWMTDETGDETAPTPPAREVLLYLQGAGSVAVDLDAAGLITGARASETFEQARATTWVGHHFAELVGADIAGDVQAQTTGTLTGAGIRYTASGLKKFYDVDFARLLNKDTPAVKAAAGQVSTGAINFPRDGVTPVQLIEMTPALSDEVLAGQTFLQSAPAGYHAVAQHLTEEEQGLVRGQRATHVVRSIKALAPDRDVADVALAGQSKRFWYEESVRAIRAIFGVEEAPRFAALLAAMSPRVKLRENFVNTAKVWKAWLLAGRPTDATVLRTLVLKAVPGVLEGSVMPNAIRALTAEHPIDAILNEEPRLSGPKVQSFYRNLLGHMEEVTNDAWIAAFHAFKQALLGGKEKPGGTTRDKKAMYLAVNAQTRRVAKKLTAVTGEVWEPAHVQAAVWSWIRTLEEAARKSKESLSSFVKGGKLTPELIAGTPNFASELLSDDTPVRSILEAAGYKDKLDAFEQALRDEPGPEPGARAGGAPTPGGDTGDQRPGGGRAARAPAGRARGATLGEIRSALRVERFFAARKAAGDVEEEFGQAVTPGGLPPPEERRGAIRFLGNHQFLISLLEHADSTTLIHEFGHFFLEMFGDLAGHVRALPVETRTPQQQSLLTDYEGMLAHLGVASREELLRAHHEEFADTFMTYLFTGKAPSIQLEGAFARFKKWLLDTVIVLKKVNVRLTPEVTAIFDRLLASEAQIQEAEAKRNVPPLILTEAQAVEMGLSPETWRIYQDQILQSHQRAVAALDAKLLADYQRQQTAEWREKRTEVEAQVEAEVHQRPVYQALYAIRQGTDPSGEAIGGPPGREGQQVKLPARLSRDVLIKEYGVERLRKLPPFLYVKEGGFHPDVVASWYGYSSGDEMLTALEQAPPMAAVIEQETTRAMIGRYGDTLLDGTLQAQAQAALANERHDAVLRLELKALAQLRRIVAPHVRQERKEGQAALRAEKKERAYERRYLEAEARLKEAIAVGKAQVEIDALELELQNLRQKQRGAAATIQAALAPDDVLRAHAEARLATQTVAAIRPEVYWTAARNAGRAAIAKTAKLDIDGAIIAKQNEQINLHLYRAAVAAKDDIKARTQYAKGLSQPAARKRIGKGGESHLDQIDGILHRFDLAPVSDQALARRAPLQDWVDGWKAQGDDLNLPPEVMAEGFAKPYQALTIEQLRAVTDGLHQIDTHATNQAKLLKAAGDSDYRTLRDRIVTSIRTNMNPRVKKLEYRGTDRAMRRMQGWFAGMRKLADLSQAFDGDVDGGAMWGGFMAPLNQAAGEKALRRGQAFDALADIWNTAYDGRELSKLHQLVHIPELNASVSKQFMVAMALNWGNLTSRDRVLNDPERKLTPDQVAAVLDRLDKRDWDFVQAVWDHVNSYWDDIVAKQQRVTGLTPEKVLAEPVHTKYGDYRGGYYPLVYDARMNPSTGQLEAASAAKLGIAAAYIHTTTARGHIEQRRAFVQHSIRYELSVMYEHVEQVLHDLTHHEVLIDTTRLIRDPLISRAIFDTYGDRVYDQFTTGLQDIALGQRPPARDEWDMALDWARTGTQIFRLGYNFWSAVQQPAGVFNGMDRVGVKWVTRGAKRWLRDAVTLESTLAWIASNSPMMATRIGATQDLSDLKQEFLQAGGWADRLIRRVSRDTLTRQMIGDSFLWHISLAQRVADTPTWLGMYEKAMADPAEGGYGETEARAFALADQAVLDSQGGGDIKDLAKIQRTGSAALRLYLTFYSYGNTVYNATHRATRILRRNKTPAGVASFLGSVGLLYVMPALMTRMLAYGLGRDPVPKDVKAFLKDLAAESLSSAMNTMIILREFGGVLRDETRGYSGPLGAQAFNFAATWFQQAKQLEWDEALRKATFPLVGTFFHLPIAQVQRTVDGAVALWSGKTHNPFVLLVGPSREDKKTAAAGAPQKY